MNDTAVVYVRVDSRDKLVAEKILDSLGISTSAAVQMFFKQIILHGGMPFDIRLPAKPIAIGNMSADEVEKLVEEGIESAKEGTYTAEEVDEMFEKNYGFPIK